MRTKECYTNFLETALYAQSEQLLLLVPPHSNHEVLSSRLLSTLCNYPHTLYQIHFTKVPEASFGTFEGLIGVTLLFDNIPLGLANRFAKSKEGLPADVALSDESFIVRLAEFLYVHGNSPAGVAVEVGKRVCAAVHRIAQINLHDNILARITEEDVPGQLAVYCCEFDTVIMVADKHFVRLDFLRQLVEELCGIEPGLA